MNQSEFGFNSFTLKWIAIITMVIDHVGYVLFPEQIAFRIVGRIAFPIFCFLLVEGFVHTKNVQKYMVRLLIFAFISEIPFDLAFSGKWFYFGYQNVFWTLFLGMLMLFLISKAGNEKIWTFIIAAGICTAAFLMQCDYSAGGIAIIFILYYFKDRPLIKYIVLALILIFGFGGIEAAGLIAIIPMLLYNGRRGPSMKYFFYLFYPCHLAVLVLISIAAG